MERDPVCGMTVDPAKAAAKVEAKVGDGAKTYYFCAKGCAARFEKDPAKFVGAARTAVGNPATGNPAAGNVAAASSHHHSAGAVVAPERYPPAAATLMAAGLPATAAALRNFAGSFSNRAAHPFAQK